MRPSPGTIALSLAVALLVVVASVPTATATLSSQPVDSNEPGSESLAAAQVNRTNETAADRSSNRTVPTVVIDQSESRATVDTGRPLADGPVFHVGPVSAQAIGAADTATDRAVGGSASTAPPGSVASQIGPTDGGVVLSSVDVPAVVAAGGTVPVTAMIENPTTETTTEDISFTLVRAVGTEGLSLVDTRRDRIRILTGSFTMGPGAAVPVSGSFPLAGVPPGSYTLVGEFGDDRAISRFTIGQAFNVDGIGGPSTATPGTPFRANVSVHNPNPFRAVQNVETRVDGRTLRTRPIQLDAGESGVFQVTFEPPAVASNRVRYGVYTHGGSATRTAELVESGAPAEGPGDGPSMGEPPSTDRVTISSRSDPRVDVVGWEDGHWYDDELALDASDGFSDAEFAAFVARAKARTEYIREREMSDDVAVEIHPPDNVTLPGAEPPATPEEAAVRNLSFEPLFILGADGAVNASMPELGRRTTGGVVISNYDGIVLRIGTTDPDARVVREDVLVHEFVHVLQRQSVGSIAELNSADSIDVGQGYRSVSEGDAEFVQVRFRERCRTDWSCVDVGDDRYPPEWNVADREDDLFANRGHMVLSGVSYTEGTNFVANVHDDGGWSAVDALFSGDVAPLSTEQVIHSERYPDKLPTAVPLPGGSSEDWQPFSFDRYGEAAIFAMFWYQASTNRTDVVDPSAFYRPDGGTYDRYNYTSTPSNGWVNDRILFFVNGTLGTADASYGYTWTTVWEDERNATEFREAYESILGGNDAVRMGNNTWVVADGPYADAFAVRQDGATVTIVNAPTVGEINGVNSEVTVEAESENTTRAGISIQEN